MKKVILTAEPSAAVAAPLRRARTLVEDQLARARGGDPLVVVPDPGPTDTGPK